MRVTKVNVTKHAVKYGLEPVQIDGIPEGFSFLEPDLEIGLTVHRGMYVAYLPMSEWLYAKATTVEDLLTRYNNLKK